MLVLFMIAIVSGAKKTSQKNGKISNNHKSMNEKENGEDYKDYDQDANPDDGKRVRKEMGNKKKIGKLEKKIGKLGNKKKIGKLEKKKKRREDSNSPVLIDRIEWLNACSMSKVLFLDALASLAFKLSVSE